MVRDHTQLNGDMKGACGMGEKIDIGSCSDEELIRRYSVEINGKRFIRASVLEAMGRRKAMEANRKPGDPGTIENPIFKSGHAYVFSSTNQLIMWEDYDGEIPDGDGVIVHLNPETTETFVLRHGMGPTEEQKRMVQAAKGRPVHFTEDCPKSSPAQLERFRKFGLKRNQQRNFRTQAE